MAHFVQSELGNEGYIIVVDHTMSHASPKCSGEGSKCATGHSDEE